MSEQQKPLKMYTAGSRYPSEYSVVAACFAHSHKEAKKLLWAGSDPLRVECDWDFTDMRVSRNAQHDDLISMAEEKEPHVIDNTAITRRMGWWCDGDGRCTCCDLATMDGDFPTCEVCEQCAECGHAEGCAAAAEDKP